MAEGGAGPGASPETRRVIHELRQPLAALQMWVDLLRESLEGQLGEAQERYLARVRGEVGRIGRVLAASAAGTLPSPLAARGEQDDRRSTDCGAEGRRDAAHGGPTEGALAGLALLVVEDDEMTAEALQLALEVEGARVAVASSVTDGLASFRRSVPDAVLSDLRVSDGDGLAMLRGWSGAADGVRSRSRSRASTAARRGRRPGMPASTRPSPSRSSSTPWSRP